MDAEASASGEFVTASDTECVDVRAGGDALREALATESDHMDFALDGATPPSFRFAETSDAPRARGKLTRATLRYFCVVNVPIGPPSSSEPQGGEPGFAT